MDQELPTSPPHHPKLDEIGALRALVNAIQGRIVSGVILALPIVLTFWIIYQIYSFLTRNIINPVADQVLYLLPVRGAEPLAGVLDEAGDRAADRDRPGAGDALYFLGWLVRSRLRLVLDWVLLRVPVVTTIYKTLSNVFESLGNPAQGNKFKRVVLVEFPHPGARSLGFVTNSLLDAKTGKTILCVCVLTGVVPPAGFTIFVPEESVTDIDWSVNQTLQAILSGGITSPATIAYFGGLTVSGLRRSDHRPARTPDRVGPRHPPAAPVAVAVARPGRRLVKWVPH